MNKQSSISSIRSKISKTIGRNKKVVACYIFGSYLVNPKKAKDIDICIIGNNLTLDEMAEISEEFSEPYDISFMHKMPYYISFRVLHEGKPLLMKDKPAFSKEWRKITHQYIEFEPVRERIFKGVVKWMSSKTS